MFEMHLVNGHHCPICVCDICGERIADASKGAVAFNSPLQVLFAHKPIEGKSCLDEAEKLLSQRNQGGDYGWDSLRNFMSYATANLGIKLKD